MKRISFIIRNLGCVGFAFLLLIVPMGIGAQPWNPQIIWEREGAGDSSRYGGAIFGLGDQNDDGFDDFAVEAWGWGGPGQENEARTEFFYGGNPPTGTPTFVYDGNLYGGAYFYGTEPIGDINGDGFIDWATSCDTSLSGYYNFRIYYGGLGFGLPPDITWQLPLTRYYEPICDFNGDGYDDIGAYDSDYQILYGSVDIDTAIDWIKHNSSLINWFGDVNGDNYSDLIEMSGDPDSLRIYFGGGEPDTFYDTGIENSIFTLAVVDLNGDGRSDLVSASNTNTQSELLVRYGAENLMQNPNAILTQACNFGSVIHPRLIGDINHDGYNDLGAAFEFCSQTNWGIASIWLGYSWLNPDPVYTFEGRSAPWDLIGIREIAGVGDVNGDSIDDFAIGAFNGDFDGFRGRAIIIAGDPDLQVPVSESLPSVPNNFSLSLYPNPFNSTLSISLSIPLHQTVTVSLYDLLGREVDVIHRGRLASSTINYAAPANLASGVYFVRAASGTRTVMQKVVLLK